MSFWGDFGVICFNHEKVVFGSLKSKISPKLTHFLYGNNHELYVESVLSKKMFGTSRRTRKKRQEYCPSEEILALQKISFCAISAIQYMSFWGDLRVKIKNNET